MKRLLFFALFFIIASCFIPMTSYGAGAERFVFSDLTATDKSTGLVWTRDANIAKKGMTWKDAFKFIEKLNKQKYAGYSDWRLPAIGELKTLVDYAKKPGNFIKGSEINLHKVLNKVGFKNVQAGWYWSSSTYASGTVLGTVRGWVVDTWAGHVIYDHRGYIVYVWPVRAGQ